jgi:hypothetical protein
MQLRSEVGVKLCDDVVFVQKVKIECLVVEWSRVLSGREADSATPRASIDAGYEDGMRIFNHCLSNTHP